jgi:ankyrin repeat protein
MTDRIMIYDLFKEGLGGPVRDPSQSPARDPSQSRSGLTTEYIHNMFNNTEYSYEVCTYACAGAAFGGHLEIVKIIYDNLDMDPEDTEWIFRDACHGGSMETVLYMMTRANLSNDLDCALRGACRGSNIEIFKMFLDIALRDNIYIDWPLTFYTACMYNCHNIIEMMFEYDIYDKELDHLWQRAIKCIFKNGNMDTINMMISKYGSYESDPRIYLGPRICWHNALFGACEGSNIDLINMAIENGANDFKQAYWHACYNGKPHIVKLMIEKANGLCDPRSQADLVDYEHGLHGACSNGNIDVFHMLIDEYPDKFPNIDFYFNFACIYGHFEIAKLICTRTEDKKLLKFTAYLSRLKFDELLYLSHNYNIDFSTVHDDYLIQYNEYELKMKLVVDNIISRDLVYTTMKYAF